MSIEALKQEIDEQHERNVGRYGDQAAATLILEVEDQVGKLRDAHLHRTDSQVWRRVVNIGSLLWSLAEQMGDDSAESLDLDPKAMFIHQLTQMGITPKQAVPTIADIFFSGDVERTGWLEEVLGKHAAGYVTPIQSRLIVSWWVHTHRLPYDEEAQ